MSVSAQYVLFNIVMPIISDSNHFGIAGYYTMQASDIGLLVSSMCACLSVGLCACLCMDVFQTKSA